MEPTSQRKTENSAHWEFQQLKTEYIKTWLKMH